MPPDLAALQAQFSAAVFGDETAEAALLSAVAGPAAAARQRLAAYRRNVFTALGNALQLSYPLVRRIVGEDCFRALARRYVATVPSASGDLNDYGEGFGEFLSAQSEAAELPYLADVACLEWQVQDVRNADDAPPAELAPLLDLPAEAWADLRFRFDPAHRRLDSRWPLASIWRVNQADDDGDMQVDWTRREAVLIHRLPLADGGDAVVSALSVGEAMLFDALRRGATLAAALEEAGEHPLDLQGLLQTLIASRLLLGIASFDGATYEHQ